jgi:hypothetical protein
MALTLASFQARFPKYATLTQPRFDIYFTDSVLEMGADYNRWLEEALYDLAQAYLIGHYLTVATLQEVGDSAPMAPLRVTDVDGVKVEYAISRDSLQATPDWLSTTSYGQQYIRYRRMAFAGPRVA